MNAKLPESGEKSVCSVPKTSRGMAALIKVFLGLIIINLVLNMVPDIFSQIKSRLHGKGILYLTRSSNIL
jgi:hypothetical protein